MQASSIESTSSSTGAGAVPIRLTLRERKSSDFTCSTPGLESNFGGFHQNRCPERASYCAASQATVQRPPTFATVHHCPGAFTTTA